MVDPAGPRSSRPEPVPSPPDEPACAGFYTPRDSRNQRRLNVWLIAASLAYAGATAAFRWRGSIPGWLPWLLGGFTFLLAIQATRSYLVFLRDADELLRRIQTEALALGFGAGAITSLLYPLLEKLGAPRLGGNATFVVMMLSLSLGAWLGTRRYSGTGPA